VKFNHSPASSAVLKILFTSSNGCDSFNSTNDVKPFSIWMYVNENEIRDQQRRGNKLKAWFLSSFTHPKPLWILDCKKMDCKKQQQQQHILNKFGDQTDLVTIILHSQNIFFWKNSMRKSCWNNIETWQRAAWIFCKMSCFVLKRVKNK